MTKDELRSMFKEAREIVEAVPAELDKLEREFVAELDEKEDPDAVEKE